MDSDVTVALPIGATLGEGPVWSVSDQALWFVDIKAASIHRFDPTSGNHRSWTAPFAPGWLLPADDGGWIVGLADGLYRFDADDGSFAPLAQVPDHPAGNRLNDAATDPAGRIWFGSMDDTEAAASGRFYCYDRGTVVDTGLAGAVVTNGPAVSPDGRTLYHVDTLGRTVDASTIRPDGTLSDTRRFLDVPADYGHPDGPVVDAEGCLWVGFFGGWAARRFAPDGRLLATVRFPTANVTKLAFGGEDLKTVYATTAQLFLDDAALAAQPLAGHVFTFRADVPGLAVTPARL